MQELIQPEGVETPAAEAITEIGETFTLQEEEATTEVRETSPLQGSPKNLSSLDLQFGKEVLISRLFLVSPLRLMLR